MHFSLKKKRHLKRLLLLLLLLSRDERERKRNRKRMAKSFSLEAFKFSVYLSIPIAMTAFFATNPSNLEDIIRRRMYVVYPASAPDPPSDAEMKKMIEEKKNKNNKNNK